MSDQHEHMDGPSTGNRQRILIVGGGLAGLAMALALKRAGRATGLDLEPVVFDERTEQDFVEGGHHLMLWRWAVDVLIEMGLGGLLSRIASPIVKFTATDSETQEDLVAWPPSRADIGTTAVAIEEELGVDSSLPPLVATRRCDLVRLLLLALSGRRDDLVMGDDFLPVPANNSDLVPDPVHGLEADLAVGAWFETENFKYMVPELNLGEKLESFSVHPATGKVTAVFESGRVEVGDMLVGADGAMSKVRSLLFNRKRSGPAHAGAAIFSGISRMVVPPVDMPDTMENGKPIEDLHRDHIHEFCPDGRSVSLVAKGLSFGLTNLGNGLLGWNLVVAQTERSQHVDAFNMIKTRKMVSEAIARNPRSSIMVPSMSFHGQAAAQFSGLSSITTDTTNPEDKWGTPSGRRMVNMFAEPEDDDTESSTTAVTSTGRKEDDDETLNTDEDDDSEVIENLRRMAFKESGNTTSWDVSSGEGSSDSSPPGSPRRMPRRGRTTATGNIAGDPDLQRRLREKLEAELPGSSSPRPGNLRIHHRSLPAPSPSSPMVSSPMSPYPNSAAPSGMMMPNLFAPPAPLNGAEVRTLALRLSMNADLPHPCHAIMARTDPSMTHYQDIEDMSEEPLETFSHQYQPGRVFLIGDAAHVVATQAHGSVGAGLALTDAALLAKLLTKHILSTTGQPGGASPTPSRSPSPGGQGLDQRRLSDAAPALAATPTFAPDADPISRALAAAAADFDRERAAMAATVMKEARAEGGWARSENGWVRSLMRFGKKITPSTWTKSSYATMLTRGAVRGRGLPSLMPIGIPAGISGL
ncbi:hypothetical protein HDU96_006412 [Phlyctochytrium bullatum]|nr:hypothetical protein HDU96_006412 [Phlyctochytrium bullatum]